MGRKVCVLAAFVFLFSSKASAQDVRTVLQSAARTMGTNNLKTVQYSGAGFLTAVGQSFSLTEDWPRSEVTDYTRVIDFDNQTMRETYTRRQGNYPVRGGGRQPVAEQRVVALSNGKYAWDLQGGNVVPQTGLYLAAMPINELRQLEIILNPHGFLKAAMTASDAKLLTTPIVGTSNEGLTGDGRKVNIVSFTALGKYKVNGSINDRNIVELVTTWIPNPVYGDMLYEFRYIEYEDVNGIKFPVDFHVHQADPVFVPAHNSFELKATTVQVNVAVPPMPVPDAVRTAPPPPPARADSTKLADGVWLIGGGSHNSMAVEFRDFAVVVEAPLNEERSLAVINEVSRVIPNKPIRYVVNTHHHFDHSGGLRTYLATGTTIVTHPANRDFYVNVMLRPGSRTLQPDRLSEFYPMYMTSRRPMRIETVGEKYVISDGVRTMDILPITGLSHVQAMLAVYLPKEKILLNADLYTPPAPGAAPPPTTAGMRSLRTNIQRLRLDVAQHVAIHGGVGTHEEFLRLVNRPAPSN
jgi:glyoxylase-like metal-dependent hydrolase (beta-lactamase superfamily II)